MCTICAHLVHYMHTVCILSTLCKLRSQKKYHVLGTPSPELCTLSRFYDGQLTVLPVLQVACPPAVWMASCGGQKWLSTVVRASEKGGAKCCQSPNQGPRPFHGSCEYSLPYYRPPAVSMGHRGGQKWVSTLVGASETVGAKSCRSPKQGPPDLSMGRVSTAGPTQDLRLS